MTQRGSPPPAEVPTPEPLPEPVPTLAPRPLPDLPQRVSVLVLEEAGAEHMAVDVPSTEMGPLLPVLVRRHNPEAGVRAPILIRVPSHREAPPSAPARTPPSRPRPQPQPPHPAHEPTLLSPVLRHPLVPHLRAWHVDRHVVLRTVQIIPVHTEERWRVKPVDKPEGHGWGRQRTAHAATPVNSCCVVRALLATAALGEACRRATAHCWAEDVLRDICRRAADRPRTGRGSSADGQRIIGGRAADRRRTIRRRNFGGPEISGFGLHFSFG
ncbi:hypothetical protein DFH07DRAFT_766208 [Mycena maculata]|uniref:Uncharacterized protein n=1 Tax=Mycena maculata TaxID=230809 RepID=A0AAD7K439_9AGAR|nr:hypothetical protein DFH07DRAFT_766208 [Mycena maculata]